MTGKSQSRDVRAAERLRGIASLVSALRCISLAAAVTVGAAAAQAPRHLIGFVEGFCPGEKYCFDLRVEPEFATADGERIRVRFADVQRIYDPENYELTLTQQDIGRGSHLRLLLDEDLAPGEYRARFIWIGD